LGRKVEKRSTREVGIASWKAKNQSRKGASKTPRAQKEEKGRWEKGEKERGLLSRAVDAFCKNLRTPIVGVGPWKGGHGGGEVKETPFQRPRLP